MPKPRKLIQPSFGARKIFVIAGNEEDAMARAQAWQAARPHRAARSTLPSTRSPVIAMMSGASALVRRDDVLHERAPDRWADVQSVNLSDA